MRPAAILLTLEEDPRETRELVHSLGYDVVEVVQQNLDRPDPQTYLGSGKLEGVAPLLAEHGARLVVVNADLKPGQIFHIEDVLRDRLSELELLDDVEERAALRRQARDASEAPGGREAPGRGRSRREGVEDAAGSRGEDVEDGVESWGEDVEGAATERGGASGVAGARGREGPEPADRRAGETGLPPLDPDRGAFEVADRVRVILEIFRRRAGTREARLQVELAKLRYEMPIVREAIHLAKTGERPGFLAGGQYAVERVHERMGKRMSRIRDELERISDERELRRKHRRRGGFHLVSLAGYTNAGKSSLLSVLTEDQAVVEDRVFTTLTTKTRRVDSERRDILLTDTVGFIEDLPPWLVEAFHSTLEEIALADVILLVVDASDPLGVVERKLRSSLNILHDFASRRLVEGNGGGAPVDDGDGPGMGWWQGATGDGRGGAGGSGGDGRGGGNGGIGGALAPVLVVLNKVDRLSPERLDEVVERLEAVDLLLGPWVATSALEGTGLDTIHQEVLELLPDYDEYVVELPQSSATESFLSWVHDHGDVRSVDRGEVVRLTFQARPRHAARLGERLQELDAKVEDAPQRAEKKVQGAGGSSEDVE